MRLSNIRTNKILSTFLLIPFFLWQSNIVYAQAVINNELPQGSNFVSGIGSVNTSGNTMNVNTSTNTIIDWNSFNIGQVNTVNFNQAGSSSVSLNRVTGGSPSSIWGQLNSNGHVFLVNPNGVFLGSSSTVDVAGFVASTLDISNTNFLAKNYKFYKNGKYSSVVNQGTINALANGGYVALLSNAVLNSGTITANVGKIALAAGESMTVALDDLSDISITITDTVKASVIGLDGNKMNDAVKNSGTIRSDKGHIILTAKVLNNIFDNAVNNSGIIQANTISNNAGRIELLADGGNIVVKGGSLISAKAGDATSKGGTVTLLSPKRTTVEAGATIDISGGSTSGNGGTLNVTGTENTTMSGTTNASAAAGSKTGKTFLNSTTLAFGSGLKFIGGITAITSGADIVIGGNVTLINATLNMYADDGSSNVPSGVPSDGNWNIGGLWIGLSPAPTFGLGQGAILNPYNHTITGTGASVLNLRAGSGIGTEDHPILVSGLSAVSANMNPTFGTGDINIKNTGSTALTMTSVSSHNGNVNLTSMDSSVILSDTVNAGTGDVNITTSNGYIFGSSNAFLSGNNLNMSATSGIGTSDQALLTGVNNINASAGNGVINIQQTGDVLVTNALTNSQEITLKATGNITAINVDSTNADINGGAEIILDSAKAINLIGNVNAGTTPNTATAEHEVELLALEGVNQTAGLLKANELLLVGEGTFDITSVGNQVNTIAADVDNSVNFKAATPTVLGTVDGVTSGNTRNFVVNGVSVLPLASASNASAAALNNQFVLPVMTTLPNVQINTFDPITSSLQAGPVFLYHPLTQLEQGGFDSQFQLDEGAYDFIDDEITKKKPQVAA